MNTQLDDHYHIFVITPPACARGKVSEFVAKKILRWRELAPSRTSEYIRSFEDNPICYLADSLPGVAHTAYGKISKSRTAVQSAQGMPLQSSSFTTNNRIASERDIPVQYMYAVYMYTVYIQMPLPSNQSFIGKLPATRGVWVG